MSNSMLVIVLSLSTAVLIAVNVVQLMTVKKGRGRRIRFVATRLALVFGVRLRRSRGGAVVKHAGTQRVSPVQRGNGPVLAFEEASMPDSPRAEPAAPPTDLAAETRPITGDQNPRTSVHPAWLKGIRGSALDVLLADGAFVVGRSSDCDLKIDDPRVSRRHLVLENGSHGWSLTDLGTANGTFVNDRRAEPRRALPLVSGDVITLGGAAFVLTVRADSAEPLRLRTGASSVRGGRPINEDAFCTSSHLVAVADGVGGRPAGEVAAGIAIDLVRASNSNLPWPHLVSAMEAVIRARSADEPDAVGMATTLEAVRLGNREGRPVMLGVHIGDGLTILDDGVQLRELTVPHTLGAQLARKDHPEARRHPERGRLLRGIGLPDAAPDLWCENAVAGQRYILSTDGIVKALGPNRLAAALAGLRHNDPPVAAAALIDLALRSTGIAPQQMDNLTVVIADVCVVKTPKARGEDQAMDVGSRAITTGRR
ncbi:FHA domain-containing protein [Nocardia yunnanensis]|nr:FHA domain-containing protein [Nocardia yunnanensis]